MGSGLSRLLPSGFRLPLASAASSIYHLYNDIQMDAMTAVTLSPKFQVVIPKHIREALQPTAGMPMQVVQYGDRIEFIPSSP